MLDEESSLLVVHVLCSKLVGKAKSVPWLNLEDVPVQVLALPH